MRSNQWIQDIREISSTARYPIGTVRPGIVDDGSLFVYSYAGATALNAGMLGVAAAINAAHMNEAITAAVTVGTTVLTLTVTAGAALAENQLRGGRFQINDGTGEGHSYRIDGNSAITATETEIIVSLDVRDPIRVALDTTSQFTLVHHPGYGVVESTTVAAPVGVAPIDVTANYYYWAQKRGLAIVYTYETTGAGYAVEQSQDLAGAVNTIDTDVTEAVVIGTIHGTAGVNTEFKPIMLNIA